MLTTYIIGSLALIIKPGPDLMCTIATALSDGKARAATLMSGLILGCWLWILLLSIGVAAFFTQHEGVMTAIQSVGVVYIAYLAFCSFRDGWRSLRASSVEALEGATGRGWRLVGRGILMSMSNPLTILFFLAFLPNFTRESASFPPSVQTLFLGTIFCALVPLIYLPIILAADSFRSRIIGSARATAALKFASALILAAVVVLLALQIRF